MPLAEPVTTHISADAQKVYEDSFLPEQSQTAGTQVSHTRGRREIWRQIAPLVRDPGGYDPTIIRFYEDVITELQWELAKYKAMIFELTKASAVEDEVEYAPGQITSLPPDLANRMRGRTQQPLPLIDHEI